MRCLALVLLVSASISAHAATWHVAKDGSGDFTVIQDAVDAATPGDTIRIHAGRYEEMVEDFDLWGDGSYFANPHVAVTKDDLTFIGDGADVTIIGPEVRPDDPPALYSGFCATYAYAGRVVYRDLAIESVDIGLMISCATSEIAGFRAKAMVEGIRVSASESCTIDDCVFNDCGDGVVSYSQARNVTVRNSEFIDGGTAYLALGTVDVLIEDCTATEMRSGFLIQQGASVTLRRVSLQGYLATGIEVCSGASAEVLDCTIVGGIGGINSLGESLWCEGTRVAGQSAAVVSINSDGATVFCDCELINGGWLTVYCLYNGSGDCHVEMTNNYWGTDSEEQIADWVYDSNDDPDRCCTVDFIPFHSESMPTEAKSWSSVKGLFEGGGEE